MFNSTNFSPFPSPIHMILTYAYNNPHHKPIQRIHWYVNSPGAAILPMDGNIHVMLCRPIVLHRLLLPTALAIVVMSLFPSIAYKQTNAQNTALVHKSVTIINLNNQNVGGGTQCEEIEVVRSSNEHIHKFRGF